VPGTPRLGRRATVAGIAFALLPALTCGLGTAVVFGFAALFLHGVGRRAAVTLWMSTAVYAVATVLLLLNVDAAAGSPADDMGVVASIILFGVGWLQALCFAPWVAMKVAGRASPAGQDVVAEAAAAEHEALVYDPSLRLALRQRERRRLSREILATDPALGGTLAIGRPDLERTFVDGGLIDVNHVPAWVLAHLPGFTQAMAGRVVDARSRFDGLRSDADLVVHADIPAEVVDALKDILVFPHGEPMGDPPHADDVR
jgi:hypothetical protein